MLLKLPEEIRAADMAAELRFAAEPAELRILAAEETPAGEKPALRKLQMTAYTGGPMRPQGYSTPVVVDLATLKVAADQTAVLKDHDTEKVVGHGKAEVTTQRIKLSGVVSGTGEDAKHVTETGANGFPWQASIGANAGQLEFVEAGKTANVNGRNWPGPLYVARNATLREVSVVALGADGSTSAKMSAIAATATKGKNMKTFEEWLAANEFDAATLKPGQRTKLQAAYDAEIAAQNPAPVPVAKVVEKQPEIKAGGDGAETEEAELKASRKRRAAESVRVEKILELCASANHSLRAKFAPIEAKAIEEGWDASKVELEVLRAGRAVAPGHLASPQPLAPQIMEAALLLASGMSTERVGKFYPEAQREQIMNAACSKRMQGASIHMLMGETIRASGGHYHGSFKSNDFIRAAFTADQQMIRADGGFSTLSVSNILEQAANKALINAYEAQEVIWPYICAIRPMPDFKPASRYRLDASGSFTKVGPDGELKSVALTDAKYTNQLDTYGALIALNRQMIINDDLNAFLQLPTFMGTMGSIRLEEAVFVLLLSLISGGTFFSTGNGNYLSGAGSALSITSLTAARAQFRNLLTPNKKPVLISPEILLTGTTIATIADNLWAEEKVMVTTATDKQNFANNPHKGLFHPYQSPYLNNTGITDQDGKALTGQSSTLWMLFANPAVRAALIVGFLNGQRTPTIESALTDFNTLGMQWRAYHDFGVASEDPVGAQVNAGS